jgi:hypothetical protein
MTATSYLLRKFLYWFFLAGFVTLAAITTLHPKVAPWPGNVPYFLLSGAVMSICVAILYARHKDSGRKWFKAFVDLIWNSWSFFVVIIIFYAITGQAYKGPWATPVLDLPKIISETPPLVQVIWSSIITTAAAFRIGIALAESFPRWERDAARCACNAPQAAPAPSNESQA